MKCRKWYVAFYSQMLENAKTPRMEELLYVFPPPSRLEYLTCGGFTMFTLMKIKRRRKDKEQKRNGEEQKKQKEKGKSTTHVLIWKYRYRFNHLVEWTY